MAVREVSHKEIELRNQPYWDARYFKNMDRISKPQYNIIEDLDIYLPLRDGAQLCTDVFRPNIEGEKFPALIAWAPYGKSLQSLKRPPIRPSSLMFDHTIESGEIEYFVPRGYAFVIPDPRGIGKSEGEWDGFCGPQEQEDIYDLVEWIAQQPWCDGNVAMIGFSYFGMIQLLAAAQQPPHLKTIMPIGVVDDMYPWFYEGGILGTFAHTFQGLCPANKEFRSYIERENSPEELKQKMRERWESDPDIQACSYLLKTLSCWPPGFNAWWLDILMHPLDDEFWAARSPRNHWHKVQIPVYLNGHWGAVMGQGQWRVFEPYMDPALDVQKKVIMYGPYWTVIELPFRYYNEEYLRWFDHWLKGIDTGLMDEPPIKIYVMGAERFRYENEWPLARTKWSKFYLRKAGELSTLPEEKEDLIPDSLVHVPPMVSNELPSVKYTTKPLNKPLEITGPLALHLYASIDAEDANFVAKLFLLYPNGDRRPITGGYLKASHRAIIHERSQPGIPIHDHTKEVPVKPGEVNEYAIEFREQSIVIMPGQKLELELATMDYSPFHEASWAKLESMVFIPNSKLIQYKFYRDAKFQSHLLLPVIPETDEELWLQPVS
ncbi:MAG: CocE/NonD family hydrolase [Deltaproteobacteria bacterium]|nr:CocE/NonD family hydrolase [Deltaproteobacteria bacterium]